MTILFGLLAAVAAMLLLGWAFSRARPEKLAQLTRVVLGAGGVILGALLTLRGLAVIGAPLAAAGLGLLGAALRGGARRAGGEGQGQGQGARPSAGSMSEREAREILGVGPDADRAEIRRAYLALMKKVHPDAGGTDSLAQRVQAAYDVLTGPR